MSETADSPDEPFVVPPPPDDQDEAVPTGGAPPDAAQRDDMLRRHVANPDDPPVHRPPQGAHGPLPGALDVGAPGRIAIVQAQVFLVGAIVVAQLWLITTALYELLSGRPQTLWWLTLASAVGFVVALVVALWPRRRVRGM
jgi:hypothetical protein